MTLRDSARFSTLCIHAGQAPDPATGAITTPIYQTSTYVQEGLGRHKGYEYARTQNPTRAALEANLAAIEHGRAGFAFASGMAAIAAVMTLLEAGDHVVVTDNTYGGTYRLFERVLRKSGLDFTYADTSRLDAIAGAILGPMDAWLVLRGTKTLPVRMERHNANALALAEMLSAHPKVARTIYPGLPSHPEHALACRQMRGFGGLVSLDLGSLDRARTLLESVRLIALAESLGGVESLISHPATMTHASVPAERRQALGITDGLVRLSVGIEDLDDLREDLTGALARL